MAAPGLRIFGVPSGMRGDREEASHQARSLPLIPKANFILDRTDTFFANPLEGASDGLATRVSMPCRVRSSPRRTRDPEASVSDRSLTLPLVTLSSYAGSLLIRNGRRFRDPYDHFLPTSPLQKSLLFISDGLEFPGGTRLTVHTG